MAERILRWFAYVWCSGVGLIILAACVSHLVFSDNFVDAVFEVLTWFSPFNVLNYLLTMFFLSPGLVAAMAAQRKKERREDREKLGSDA